MQIKMLWGQRVCSYAGQYAPELLLAVDENCEDENPDYFQEEERKFRLSGEFTAITIIEGSISDAYIEQSFKNTSVTIRVE
jgi:hypothetical protein